MLQLIIAPRGKVEGIKISLLDAGKEIALRRRLPEGVLMYTGDDFNYAELIEGDGTATPTPCSASSTRSRRPPPRRCRRSAPATGRPTAPSSTPTVPLSRRIFEAPTQYYKAGVVFLAWLNGHQNHFTMIGGMQSARGILHYADVFRLADQAGLLRDPDLAAERMRSLLRSARHRLTVRLAISSSVLMHMTEFTRFRPNPGRIRSKCSAESGHVITDC